MSCYNRDWNRFWRGLLSQCTLACANNMSNPSAYRPQDLIPVSHMPLCIVTPNPSRTSLNPLSEKYKRVGHTGPERLNLDRVKVLTTIRFNRMAFSKTNYLKNIFTKWNNLGWLNFTKRQPWFCDVWLVESSNAAALWYHDWDVIHENIVLLKICQVSRVTCHFYERKIYIKMQCNQDEKYVNLEKNNKIF